MHNVFVYRYMKEGLSNVSSHSWTWTSNARCDSWRHKLRLNRATVCLYRGNKRKVNHLQLEQSTTPSTRSDYLTPTYKQKSVLLPNTQYFLIYANFKFNFNVLFYIVNDFLQNDPILSTCWNLLAILLQELILGRTDKRLLYGYYTYED